MTKEEKLIEALTAMVEQYLLNRELTTSDESEYHHNFMCAGRLALNLLTDLGIMKPKGSNWVFVKETT